MSTHVHAPYLVPGWEMCLPSINPKKEPLWTVQETTETGMEERDICREPIRIILPQFTFKDTSNMVLHANKGTH